jgi:hypothetical protein
VDTLEPALRAAQTAPDTRVLEFTRGALAEPLTGEDVREALPVASALEPALAALDAATVDAQCVLPSDLEGARARLARLADQLLVLATLDAAAGKPRLAAAHVSRSADVARLLVRCDGATLETLEHARTLIARARTFTGTLIDSGWLDRKGALRAAAALDPPTDAELLRCGGPLADAKALADTRTRLRADGAAEKALVARAGRAPERIEQGDKVGVPDVDVRCARDARTGRFQVSRSVLAVLRARGAEAILADSQLFPALDGTGILVVRAGPGARSCGFADTDVLVAINGRGVTSAADVLAAREIVAADGRARFTVRRAGAITDLELEPQLPASPTPPSATPPSTAQPTTAQDAPAR